MRAKIVFINIVILAFILCGFAAILYQKVRSNAYSTIDSRLDHFANDFILETSMGISGEIKRPDSSHLLTWKKEGPLDLQWGIIDEKGHYLYGTIMLDFNRAWAQSRAYSNVEFDNRHFRVLQRNIPHSALNYRLIAIAPNDNINETLRHLLIIDVIVIPLALIFAAAAMFWSVSYGLRPVRHLIDTASVITGKNLEHRIDVAKSRDEVRQLAIVFNQMLDRLDAAFKSQKRFVADASHEIRTPLATLRCELEYLGRFRSRHDANESINVALEEIDRLSVLTDGLLTLACIDSGRMDISGQPISVLEIIREVITLVQPLADAKQVLIEFHAKDGITCVADRDGIGRAVRNLCENAIKFTPHGGKVSVSVVHVGSNAIIKVADTGPGIAIEEQSRIFDRFYRSMHVPSDVSGSGLGLPIAKELVELSRGSITVQSEPGKGSSFIVTIPSE